MNKVLYRLCIYIYDKLNTKNQMNSCNNEIIEK